MLIAIKICDYFQAILAKICIETKKLTNEPHLPLCPIYNDAETDLMLCRPFTVENPYQKTVALQYLLTLRQSTSTFYLNIL